MSSYIERANERLAKQREAYNALLKLRQLFSYNQLSELIGSKYQSVRSWVEFGSVPVDKCELVIELYNQHENATKQAIELSNYIDEAMKK
jgi:hypothetical protein